MRKYLIGVLFFCFALTGQGNAENCAKISDPEAQKRCVEENGCVMTCHFDFVTYKFTDKTSTACLACNKSEAAKRRAGAKKAEYCADKCGTPSQYYVWMLSKEVNPNCAVCPPPKTEEDAKEDVKTKLQKDAKAFREYCASNCGTPQAYDFPASWDQNKPTCRDLQCPDPRKKAEKKPAQGPVPLCQRAEGEEGLAEMRQACRQEQENKNTERQLEQSKGWGEDVGAKIKNVLEPAKQKWQELLSRAQRAGDESTETQAEQQLQQIEQNVKAGVQRWQQVMPAINQGIANLVTNLNQGIEDFRKTGVAGTVTRGSPEAKISNPKCGRQSLGQISDPKCAQIQEGTSIELGKGHTAGFSSPAVGNTDVRGEGKGAGVRYEDCKREKQFGCKEVLEPGEGGITVRKQFPDPENDYKPKGLTRRDIEEFNKGAGLEAEEHALKVKFDGADPKQNKNLQLVPGVGQVCPFCGGVPYIEDKSGTPQILRGGERRPSKPRELKIKPPPLPKRPSEEGDPEFVTFVAADKVTTIVVLKGSITFFPEMKKKKEQKAEVGEEEEEERTVIIIKEGEMLKVRPGQPPPPLKVSKVNLKKVKRWWEGKEAKKPKEERGERQD